MRTYSKSGERPGFPIPPEMLPGAIIQACRTNYAHQQSHGLYSLCLPRHKRRLTRRAGATRSEKGRFIEDTVKWRMLDQSIYEARRQLADVPPGAMEDLIGEAVAATRKARPAKTG